MADPVEIGIGIGIGTGIEIGTGKKQAITSKRKTKRKIEKKELGNVKIDSVPQ